MGHSRLGKGIVIVLVEEHQVRFCSAGPAACPHAAGAADDRDEAKQGRSDVRSQGMQEGTCGVIGLPWFWRPRSRLALASCRTQQLPDGGGRDSVEKHAAADLTPGTLSEGEARDIARREGTDQIATDATTETSQVVAHPDGTFTMTASPRPVRVETADGWQPIDNALQRRADGTIAPKRPALDMTFSGGGTGPLIALKRDDHETRIKWTGQTLPAPSWWATPPPIRRSCPEFDLVIRADIDAFSHVLVVKTRQAATNPAIRELAFDIESDTLTTTEDRTRGVIEQRDPSGKVVVAAPGPCPRSLDTRCVGLRGFRDGSRERVLVGVRGHLAEVGVASPGVVADRPAEDLAAA